MTKRFFMGDPHYSFGFSDRFFHPSQLPKETIMLGDVSVEGFDHWPGESGKNHYFIEGNHDLIGNFKPMATEPYEISTGLIHIPKGHIIGKTMFIGGEDDFLFQDQFLGNFRSTRWSLKDPKPFILKALKNNIECMVTHGPPYIVLPHLHTKNYPDEEYSHSANLQKIFNVIKPKLWIFGHHHVSFNKEISGCQFVCLSIREIKEIDIP